MNKQITEDYVSYEIAKLLKEKGFDCACKVWYSEYTSQFGGEKYTSIEFDNHNKFNENYKFICSAPTHQMALKWLREVHRIETHIVLSELNADNSRKYMFDIYSSDINRDFDSVQKEGFNSYEQAVEAAILYILKNLI